MRHMSESRVLHHCQHNTVSLHKIDAPAQSVQMFPVIAGVWYLLVTGQGVNDRFPPHLCPLRARRDLLEN